MYIEGRPVINIDLDGVVYNWVDAIGGILSRRGEEYTKWEIWEDWRLPKGEFFRNWQRGIEQDVIYKQGRPIADAVRNMWKLSDDDWHIRIITDRLNHFGLHEQVVTNTAYWLEEWHVPYRSLAFDSNKTHRALAGVDDKVQNVQDMLLIGIKPFLFTAPHNATYEILPRSVDDMERVDNWAELYKKVTAYREVVEDHG